MKNIDDNKKSWLSMKSGKIIGAILMIISVIFILKMILNMDFQSIKLEHPLISIIYLLIFSLIYVVSVGLEGYGWNLILQFLHGEKIPYKRAIQVYAKSNVGKYLPGNVLHFAGRNLMGARLGWNHAHILASSFLEVVLVFISASIFAAVFTYREFVYILGTALKNLMGNKWAIGLILGAILVIGVGIWVIAKKTQYLEKLKIFFTPGFWKLFLQTLLVYSVKFFIRGMLLVLVFKYILQAEVALGQILIVVSASVLAWLAGFVAIGVPGGLGVRESVLILMVTSLFGKENIVVAALLHRLISVLGDVATFGLIILFPKLGITD